MYCGPYGARRGLAIEHGLEGGTSAAIPRLIGPNRGESCAADCGPDMRACIVVVSWTQRGYRLNAVEEYGMDSFRSLVAVSLPMISRGGVRPHYAWTVLVLSHSSVDGRLLIRLLRLFA